MLINVPKFLSKIYQTEDKFTESKTKTENMKFQNLTKKFLGNFVKMMCIKGIPMDFFYGIFRIIPPANKFIVHTQYHPKSRSLLNHVPKFAQCETRSKQIFKVEKRNKKFEIPEFWTELYK